MSTWTPIAPGAVIPFPSWLYAQQTGHTHLWRSKQDMTTCEPLWQLYTHYLPQDNGPMPAPPARELTQQEKDEAAGASWIDKNTTRSRSWHCGVTSSCEMQPAPKDAWHAALSYRDAENRKDLAEVTRYAAGSGIDRLCQRAGIQP
jgi:hypothetical protein